MDNILKLLENLGINSHVIYKQIIKNQDSILIKKSTLQNSNTRAIKELVTIYEIIDYYKNIEIEVLENGDILIKKIFNIE